MELKSKKLIIFLIILLFVSFGIFATTNTKYCIITYRDSPNMVKNLLEDVSTLFSLVISILSVFISLHALRENRPHLKIKGYPIGNSIFIEIRNTGHIRTFLKISNYYLKDNEYKTSCFEQAYFSEVSKKWIEINKTLYNRKDEIVHDYLYEIEPLEVLSFIVPFDEYESLFSSDGGFFIRETSGSFYMFCLKTMKSHKISKRKQKRLDKKCKK